jgi:signal transduction histidine kinase
MALSSVNRRVAQIPYESEDRSTRWLLAALEITRALLQETDARAALRLVARRLREVSAADYVSISLADPRYPEGTALVEAIDGLGAEHLSGKILFNNRQGLWTIVARSGKGFVSRDITSHPAFNPPMELADSVSVLGLGMYLPLTAAGKVLGVMSAGWQRGSPYEEMAAQEVPLMEMFAGEVALALQQGRAQMLVMEDRDRIARELQEVALTRLFAIGTHLHTVSGMAGQAELRDRLGQAIDDLDETIRQIGHAIFALGDARSSDRKPVSVRLVEEVDAASNVLGFTPRLVVRGLLDHRLPAHLGSELVTAVRESLANAATHNAVSIIDVSVQMTEDQLALTVTDDGTTGTPSAGISAVDWLREKAQRLGGTVTVDLAGPAGSVLSWRVPLDGNGTGTDAGKDVGNGTGNGAGLTAPRRAGPDRREDSTPASTAWARQNRKSSAIY